MVVVSLRTDNGTIAACRRARLSRATWWCQVGGALVEGAAAYALGPWRGAECGGQVNANRGDVVSAIRDDAVMLYDGLCGFCDGTVQFILDRDRKRTLRFAPLQGDFAREFFVRHPELRTIDSIILVQTATASDGELVSSHSDAIVLLSKYVGGFWNVFGAALQIIPRFLRDWGYRTFAKIRYRAFGRRDACRVPTSDERGRFIA